MANLVVSKSAFENDYRVHCTECGWKMTITRVEGMDKFSMEFIRNSILNLHDTCEKALDDVDVKTWGELYPDDRLIEKVVQEDFRRNPHEGFISDTQPEI